MELELTDREYYEDPYGPLDPPEQGWCGMSWEDEEIERVYWGQYYDNMYHDDIDFNVDLNDPVYEDDDWDEGDLTEAQYQDRSWDEYEDEVFYNSEDLEDGQ